MLSVYVTIIGFIIILSLASIGGMITEKSGVVNLSIEAFMVIGAVSYSLLARKFGEPTNYSNYWMQWILMPIAGLITALFSIIYSYTTVKLKANQTIVGIAFNALTIAISYFLIKNFNDNRNNIKIYDTLWGFSKYSNEAGSFFNIALLLGIPIVGLLFVFLNKTKLGKTIKAVGENPHASASLGINVDRTRVIAIAISAFVVGISGALFAQRSSGFFFGGVYGFGFLAVSLVIFGQWKPSIILAGSVLFGITYGMTTQINIIPFLAKIESREIIYALPYAISLSVLIFTSKKSRAPKALGVPYINAGR